MFGMSRVCWEVDVLTVTLAYPYKDTMAVGGVPESAIHTHTLTHKAMAIDLAPAVTAAVYKVILISNHPSARASRPPLH